MREVQISDAKTYLLQLLDDVEHGETIVITRHGRPIARIVPEPEPRQAEIDQALAEIKEIHARTRHTSIKEILTSIHEGHKY